LITGIMPLVVRIEVRAVVVALAGRGRLSWLPGRSWEWRQPEDLAAVEAVACPQRCGPGAQQGIDEVFPVLVGSIADR
jgi:hypothetical protein